MLREFHFPSAASFIAEEVASKAPDNPDDVVLWDGTEADDKEQPVVGDLLQPSQQAELRQLLLEFTDVLSSRPGRTQIAECSIQTGTTAPIRLPPYRLPHAYRDIVKEGLDEMEREGIIERSSSEWAFPIVLVKKKDGSLRMCVDYRRLNAISHADAYPMPRVDDMIDVLGKAKCITTLDLARGYLAGPRAGGIPTPNQPPLLPPTGYSNFG